jgi:hypothetical protein
MRIMHLGRIDQEVFVSLVMYSSTGILRYFDNPYKLIVEVDTELVRYYRSLVPKYRASNPQRYAPHISVIRKETPPNLDLWGEYEGYEIAFEYSGEVQFGTVYQWLNVYSDQLIIVRQGLGLPPTSVLSRPPDGRVCFHVTIGNSKDTTSRAMNIML